MPNPTTPNPTFTQEPLLHVDATPDEEYPLRILKAHRENCNMRYSDNTAGKPPSSELIAHMNEVQEKRAKILDKAIKVLEASRATEWVSHI